MSVLDDLRRAQEQLVARLQELEPLVAEYQELRQAADRLGLTDPGAPAPAAAAPQDAVAGQDTHATAADAAPADATPADTAPADTAPATPARAKAKAPARRRPARTSSTRSATRQPGGSRGGSREEAILRLVAATPGITVTAAGKELGVDPTGLYRPVRKLMAEGRIDKRGPALHPAE